jgi:hypothetical protein
VIANLSKAVLTISLSGKDGPNTIIPGNPSKTYKLFLTSSNNMISSPMLKPPTLKIKKITKTPNPLTYHPLRISPKRPNPSIKIKKTPKVVQNKAKAMFPSVSLSQFQTTPQNKKLPKGKMIKMNPKVTKMTKMSQSKRFRQGKNKNRSKGKRPK